MKTQFVAHRGASFYVKENTVAAFTYAGKTNEYFGIETDTHITTDGVFVTLHDAQITRVTAGKSDLNVEKVSYQEARAVELPSVDGTYGHENHYIPKVAEYLSICKQYQKEAVLELKQNFDNDQLAKLISIIKECGDIEHTTFICFGMNPLVLLKGLLPNCKIQFLCCKPSECNLDFLAQNKMDVDIEYHAVTEEFISECHKRGILVNAWTVDDLDAAKKLASWNIDFITSNKLKSLEG